MRPVLLMVAALVLAPAAAAAIQPSVLFLQDGDLGPLGPGSASTDVPTSETPLIRPILPVPGEISPTRFVLPLDPNATHLAGPLFVAAWPGPALSLDSQLGVAAYHVKADGSSELLNTTLKPYNLNPEALPSDPTLLIPPDPSDPAAAALYIAAQLAPAVLEAPLLYDLGRYVLELEEGDSIEIAFFLTGSTAPIPIGLAGTLQYGSPLAPTYAYVPLFYPDPPRSSSSTSAGGSSGMSSTSSSSMVSSSSTSTPTQSEVIYGDDKDTPTTSVLALVGAVLAAALIARRRFGNE